jgi:DNA-binding NtrC family response regulator
MARALDQCARFARSRNPVVLTGEPGTGKTVLAEYIHQLSARSGEFVKVSASHIPPGLELGHLGGHNRGSYTGAERDQAGLLETAHGGTFFLDELGNASATVQEILLQVIEEGTIRRVRDVRTRPLDVRFIFATNVPLEGMVDHGVFRRDLYDRLGFCKIAVPSLADRREDIEELLMALLRRESEAVGLAEPLRLERRLIDCLLAAPWKGNVRELENLCKYLVVFGDLGRPLDMHDLPYDFAASLGGILRRQHDGSALAHRAREALATTGGDKSAAARLLGISRTHLYRLLKPA